MMPNETTNLYASLKAAGCETDSWQSDLYVLDTEEARQIIEAFESEGGITNKKGFHSEVDGRRWIELPFAYQPYWDSKARNEATSDSSVEDEGSSLPTP